MDLDQPVHINIIYITKVRNIRENHEKLYVDNYYQKL